MAQFEPIWVLGCMSGTSMDGIDCASILTDGVEILDFGPSASLKFTCDERATIASATGLWPGDKPDLLDKVADIVLNRHIDLISSFEGPFDLIGFHGQTLSHDSAHGRTFQIGDGAALARAIGVRTVWDFRTPDMEAGGEGAPLAPIYHFACARRIGATEPIACLNLGGVGNVTWINPTAQFPEDHGALLAFDTGPASALIDDFVKMRRDLDFDAGGELAAQGIPDAHVIERFLEHSYFSTSPPKSLDRNTFDFLLEMVSDKSDADGAATLTAASVASVVRSVEWMPSKPERWLVCGGGRMNFAMLDGVHEGLCVPVDPIETVGLRGDLIEAQAFAYLAMRVMHELPTAVQDTTGCSQPHSGGRISEPV